jgi:alkylation response protein AidB-like acyl-CoA dehydrogenase
MVESRKKDARQRRRAAIVDEIALAATTRLFEVAGASAARRSLLLDRHWRNARTIAQHIPAIFMARYVGGALIKDEELPANGFF